MDNSTRFEVDAAHRERADNCYDCHMCLEDTEFELCRVDFYIENSAVLISTRRQCRVCGYKRPFADGHLCLCPVHEALFRRYGI